SAKDLAAFNDGLSHNLEEFQALFEHMKEVTDGFSEGTTKLNNHFSALFSYFKKIDAKNERMVKAFEQTQEKVTDVSKAQMDTLEQFEDAVTELQTFVTSILERQASLKDAFEGIHRQNGDLVEKMKQHNKRFKDTFG